MYDYSEVLALLDKSDRFHDELEASFEKMKEQGGGSVKASGEVLESIRAHFTNYNLSPMIVEIDLEGNITYANSHFIKASKYDYEELLGQNINLLKSSHVHPGLYRDIWNHMEEQRSWRGTLRNTAKDFESYWIDSCICPVLDNEGKTIKYWSLSYDISDQIKVQQELEDKNNELMDSMRYAKRIQKTILPDKKTMDKTLDDHFTIYKPKDIVSGDFYWTTSTIDKVFIAAVDCTGHGVPGAFMSLIGYNLLNQIVIQRRIHTPGLILTELHKGVRATLKQDSSDSKSRDGMDITLVAIDRFDDRIQFAGAYNPLYWHDQKELHIIKGDKMAIGGEQMEDERVFTNHEIEIKPGDCIYLTTDGFVDQFGGPEGKKFGTKRLKELIEENWHEKMTVQRALFNLKWKDWIMDGEQIDDVTIIGIKFTDEEEGEK